MFKKDFGLKFSVHSRPFKTLVNARISTTVGNYAVKDPRLPWGENLTTVRF